MSCRTHISIQREAYGSMSECSNCHLPIIFDGTKWRWTGEIGTAKVRKMNTAYQLDRLTGKHG